MNDEERTSDYLVDLGQRSYIVLIDKKYKAIFDIISQDTISLFTDSNDVKIQNSELIKRYLNENKKIKSIFETLVCHEVVLFQ
jgi:hypothetical protein